MKVPESPAGDLTPPCPFPHAVELLRFLGSLREEPELARIVEAENVISWVSLRFHELTGIPYIDILQAVVRLAEGKELDGTVPGGFAEGYSGQPLFDLSHVAAPLHELDKDGSTERIWRQLCIKWPFFAKGAQRARQPELPRESGAGAQQEDGRALLPSTADTPETRTDGELLVSEAPSGQAANAMGKKPVPPRRLLTGWRDICTALQMKYGDRDKIRSLNTRYEGPIRNKGRGTQPMVYNDDLVEWWNVLAARQQELANRRAGVHLSAEDQHNYGRDGTAAPEIGGGVKKRRRDKSV